MTMHYLRRVEGFKALSPCGVRGGQVRGVCR